MRRRAAAVVVAVLAAVTGVGCGDDAADDEDMREGFASVVAAAAVDDLDGPHETTSKDITYLTGSGLVEGDPDTAAERAVFGLREAGWEVTEVGPGGGGGGVRVLANSGDVATQMAVHTEVGARGSAARSARR